MNELPVQPAFSLNAGRSPSRRDLRSAGNFKVLSLGSRLHNRFLGVSGHLSEKATTRPCGLGSTAGGRILASTESFPGHIGAYQYLSMYHLQIPPDPGDMI